MQHLTKGPNLTDHQIDCIERLIGKQALYMFNKVWQERQNLVQTIETQMKPALALCEKENRLELRYWQVKIKEATAVLEFQNKVLTDTIKLIDDKLSAKVRKDLYDYLKECKVIE